jgi:hypothetical protein
VNGTIENGGNLILSNNGGEAYVGKMDEVRVWNSVLDSAELSAGYESGHDDLLAYGLEDGVVGAFVLGNYVTLSLVLGLSLIFTGKYFHKRDLVVCILAVPLWLIVAGYWLITVSTNIVVVSYAFFGAGLVMIMYLVAEIFAKTEQGSQF